MASGTATVRDQQVSEQKKVKSSGNASVRVQSQVVKPK